MARRRLLSSCMGIIGASILELSCTLNNPNILDDVNYRYNYFESVNLDSAYYSKIVDWQRRVTKEGSLDLVVLNKVNSNNAIGKYNLLNDYMHYLDEIKNERYKGVYQQVENFSRWFQEMSIIYFVHDGNGNTDMDYWETFGETLSTNGDDCDGLSNIPYDFLQRIGISKEEVYKGILRKDSERHMVILWFDRKDNPLVIDPTGASTKKVKRLSELIPLWIPERVFSEDKSYNVGRINH